MVLFLLDKAVESEEIAHRIHWHFYLEKNNVGEGGNPKEVNDYYKFAYIRLMDTLELDFPEAKESLEDQINFR